MLELAYESSYSTSNTEDSRTTSNETETKRPSSSQSDDWYPKRPEVRGEVVIAAKALLDIQVKMIGPGGSDSTRRQCFKLTYLK